MKKLALALEIPLLAFITLWFALGVSILVSESLHQGKLALVQEFGRLDPGDVPHIFLRDRIDIGDSSLLPVYILVPTLLMSGIALLLQLRGRRRAVIMALATLGWATLAWIEWIRLERHARGMITMPLVIVAVLWTTYVLRRFARPAALP